MSLHTEGSSASAAEKRPRRVDVLSVSGIDLRESVVDLLKDTGGLLGRACVDDGEEGGNEGL